MSVLEDIRRGWRLRGDGVAVEWSPHALQRYAERIRPSMDIDRVREELCHLLSTAVVSRTPPEWLRKQEADRKDAARKTIATAYLLLADGEVCLPLVARDGEWMAVTTLLPGMTEGRQREGRNAAKARARAGRRAARKAAGNQGGRPPRPPEASEWDPSQ